MNMPANSADLVVNGRAYAHPDRPVVVIGIPDAVVVDSGDAILVTTRQAAQDVKHAAALAEPRSS